MMYNIQWCHSMASYDFLCDGNQWCHSMASYDFLCDGNQWCHSMTSYDFLCDGNHNDCIFQRLLFQIALEQFDLANVSQGHGVKYSQWPHSMANVNIYKSHTFR